MSKESQNNMIRPKSVDELLLEFQGKNFRDNSSLISFKGVVNGKDIYNITAPFESDGRQYIAGRVEARDSEYAEIMFFQQSEDGWTVQKDIPSLPLQDPFVTRIGGELIVGGVEVFDDVENCGKLNYRTVFYKGKSLRDLERFAHGPDRMKDIRLCQLEDKRILVMTRPQGAVGGRGKIGYIIIDHLNQLNIDNIERARVPEGQFLPEEWGGCNELHLLKNGKVGVLCHIAKYDKEENRHYYAAAFCFDTADGSFSPMKIIAIRDNFQEGPSKRDDLKDVIFSGGLVRRDHMADLYCGVSDVQGHMITIRDPFVSFEHEVF